MSDVKRDSAKEEVRNFLQSGARSLTLRGKEDKITWACHVSKAGNNQLPNVSLVVRVHGVNKPVNRAHFEGEKSSWWMSTDVKVEYVMMQYDAVRAVAAEVSVMKRAEQRNDFASAAAKTAAASLLLAAPAVAAYFTNVGFKGKVDDFGNTVQASLAEVKDNIGKTFASLWPASGPLIPAKGNQTDKGKPKIAVAQQQGGAPGGASSSASLSVPPHTIISGANGPVQLKSIAFGKAIKKISKGAGAGKAPQTRLSVAPHTMTPAAMAQLEKSQKIQHGPVSS